MKANPMSSNKMGVARLAGLMLTVIILIGYYSIPPRRVVLFPQSHLFQPGMTGLYGFVHPTTGPSAEWISEKKYEWICHYLPENIYGCGFEIRWDPKFVNGIDLSAYEGIDITLNYEGDGSRLRFYVRNYNVEYSFPNDATSSKYMSMSLRAKELSQGALHIKLSELSVADWWLKERHIRRKWSAPELTNIVSMGVEVVEKGEHRVRVNKIELVGNWIEEKTLLLCIVALWMCIFILDGLLNFYYTYKRLEDDKKVAAGLKNSQSNLEEERENLRLQSAKDPLTGVCNRAGITSYINSLFEGEGTDSFGILLLSIDRFKHINDTCGHDVGDRVLKDFTCMISNNLREADSFARWGGDEFILISPGKTKEGLIQIAEKLRKLVANNKFGSHLNLTISMSIGATLAAQEDGFDVVFKRTEKSLLRAKDGGRNRVEFDGG